MCRQSSSIFLWKLNHGEENILYKLFWLIPYQTWAIKLNLHPFSKKDKCSYIYGSFYLLKISKLKFSWVLSVNCYKFSEICHFYPFCEGTSFFLFTSTQSICLCLTCLFFLPWNVLFDVMVFQHFLSYISSEDSYHIFGEKNCPIMAKPLLYTCFILKDCFPYSISYSYKIGKKNSKAFSNIFESKFMFSHRAEI